MTADYYSILGVSPAAEDVVIRAAYRALMRHYHPDTNSDPEAQRRAKEITAAFAVLRDPASRAEYDVNRNGPALWRADEIQLPSDRRPPPAMRGLALASVGVAVALVTAVLMMPQPRPPAARGSAPASARHVPAPKPKPVVELEPESERLARLGASSEAALAPPPAVPLVDQSLPVESALKPPIPVPVVNTEPAHVFAQPPRRAVARPAHAPSPIVLLANAAPARPKAVPAPAEPSADCRPGGSVAISVGCKNERLATLDRMAAGFFSQSMAHADAAKKQLLLTSHTRSAEARSACRSESCLSDAYLRQMREISAIMEGRAPPVQ